MIVAASRSENWAIPLSLKILFGCETLPQEVENLNSGDPLVAPPVDPAESRVGLKFRDVGEPLSLAFDLELLVGDGLKEVPEPVLGFDAKH